MPSANNPVWFITGCSTGFGRELAKSVLGRGPHAVVTARDSRKVHDIATPHGDRALALSLDVTNRPQCEAAVKEAEARFGRIDVLVNNAGYGYLGAVEESEEQPVRAMFETNFFGLARLIHLILPGMRERRRGHIVNISSMGGLVGLSGVGYYNATKFAVEGLSEALAHEVAPLGVKVTIVEPGPFRTDWAGRSILKSPKSIPEYSTTAGATIERIQNYSGQQPGDPVRAAEAIIKAVESPTPPLRLLLGRRALDTVREKLDALRRELDAWQEVTFGADFPNGK
jgi:NAD(P)-dependent dehydrogenase (short-subunit alcohol dehydrogenase family)